MGRPARGTPAMSDPFHIPWAPNIQVEGVPAGGGKIKGFILRQEGVEARVLLDEDVPWIFNLWEKKILNWMVEDEHYSRKLQEFLGTVPRGRLKEAILEWLKGRIFPGHFPPGRKEWRPGSEPTDHPEVYSIIELENTEYRTSWFNVLPDFDYIWFKTTDDRDGLVVYNESLIPGEPTVSASVWFGDVDAFFRDIAQFHPRDFDAPFRANQYFENGILWAYTELGLMDRFAIIPGWILRAIKDDPDLLWPELVSKLEKIFDTDFFARSDWVDLIKEWKRLHGGPNP